MVTACQQTLRGCRSLSIIWIEANFDSLKLVEPKRGEAMQA